MILAEKAKLAKEVKRKQNKARVAQETQYQREYMPDHVKNNQSQVFLRKMQERKQIGSRISNLQKELYRA